MQVLEELDLSVLTLLVNEDDDADSSREKSNIDHEKNLTELMQLFQELVKTPAIRTKLLEVFTVTKMRILMKNILECTNDSVLLEKPRNLFNVSISHKIIKLL